MTWCTQELAFSYFFPESKFREAGGTRYIADFRRRINVVELQEFAFGITTMVTLTTEEVNRQVSTLLPTTLHVSIHIGIVVLERHHFLIFGWDARNRT